MSLEHRFPSIKGTHGPIWRVAPRVTVSKSVDGTYEVKRYENDERKRTRFDSLDKALQLAELFALRNGLKLNTVDGAPEGTYSFDDASRDWYSMHTDWSDSTKERYRGFLDKHILPVLGGYRIGLHVVASYFCLVFNSIARHGRMICSL